MKIGFWLAGPACLALAACSSPPPSGLCPDATSHVSFDGGEACVRPIDAGTDAPACPPGESLAITSSGIIECRPAPPSSCDAARAVDAISFAATVARTGDGRALSILWRGEILRTTWLRSTPDLNASGASLRWFYTDDTCPFVAETCPAHALDVPDWWGLHVADLEPMADGSVALRSSGCLVGPSPALTARVLIIEGGALGCWQGHHPCQDVACGTITASTSGTAPWVWTETTRALNPHTFIVGIVGGLPTLIERHLETGDRSLVHFDAAGAERARVALGLDQGLADTWVSGLGDETWVARLSPTAGECLRVDRLRGEGRLPTLWVPPAPGAATSATLSIAGAPATRFLVTSATATSAGVYLVEVGADGRGDAEPLVLGATSATVSVATAVGGDLLLVAVVEDPTRRLVLLRTDLASGVVREELELPTTFPSTMPAAITHDEASGRVFVVLTTPLGDAASSSAVEVLTIELGPA